MGARGHVLLLLLSIVASGLLVDCGGSAQDAPVLTREHAGVEATPARFWQVFRAASTARREHDLDLALARYTEALQINPDHPDALYYAGQLRYLRGETGRAAALFAHLVEVEPRGLRAWQQLSLVSGQPRPGWAPDLDAATAAAQQALELDRSESLNNLLLARWAAYSGDEQDAHQWLQLALGHNPGLQGALRLGEWLQGVRGAGWSRTAPSLVRLGRRHRVDLDGDGKPDLDVLGQRGRPAALGALGGGDFVLLPTAVRLRAWERTGSRSGPWPVPAAAALMGAGDRERIVVLGGGPQGARSYARRSEVYVEVSSGLPEISGPPVLAVADFDGDGRDDLVLGNVALSGSEYATSVGVRLYRGSAEATFVPAEFQIRGPVWAATAADLDGDGDADLVVVLPAGPVAEHAKPPAKVAVASGAAWQIQIWRNDDARLRRGASLVLPPGQPLRQLGVADVNGDGRVDVLALVAGMPELAGGGLWLGSDAGFSSTDEPAPLGSLQGAVMVWGLEPGVLIAAGGAVPGDPRRYRTLHVSPGAAP